MTHQYSIDTQERPRITVWLAIISVALTFALQRSLGLANIQYWWLPAPSAMTIFWGVHYLFDSYLWKCALFQRVGLVRTRHIAGIWAGRISSSHQNFQQMIDARLRIVQTWTTIEFSLETAQSTSRSHSAHVALAHPEDVRICYQYVNEPKVGSAETMNIHRGTAILELSPDGTRLTGDYYTGRGRGTEGTMEFARMG